ncbi:hypothetical protein [Litorisediminicola beolgyonensis]|uniref:Uncharacterized protein n=1 Tax=Litorisediminicola beolgyonensis TaxID=1173614 RepID=A0ABW3ZHE7_9RHOB
MGGNSSSYHALILSAVAINLAVLVVFVVLSILQYGQVRSELERERLRIVADRAAEPLASAAAIGLDISAVRNLRAILERSKQADDAILALRVLEPDGEVRISTFGDDHETIGTETLRRLKTPDLPPSYREKGDFRYLVTFGDGQGGIAGALLTEYSGATTTASVWAMAGRLATAALLFCILGSLASAYAVRRALSPEMEIDRQIADQQLAQLRRHWRGHSDSATAEHRDDIAQALREAEAAYLDARDARS